jgi:hypothetical protein
VQVSADVFRQVYESPASLPGREKWVTPDEDVRGIERLLGMAPNTIGAPLCVSGDTRTCKHCGRQTSWLDIVSSALKRVHGKEMIAEVILGDRKFVNVEVPHAIEDLFCHQCGKAHSGPPQLQVSQLGIRASGAAQGDTGDAESLG